MRGAARDKCAVLLDEVCHRKPQGFDVPLRHGGFRRDLRRGEPGLKD